MFQNPIIVVCSGGLSGLIFALSLSEVFVTKEITGKILLYHEYYKIRNSKDQSSSLNKNEILRLPQSVRDYVSSPYSLHGFEDRLLELIKKLPKETVQLIHERFDPAQTSQDFRFDLLVLADGYSVNLYDSCQFEKEVISNHYELEINFSLTENHFQNSEIEILSSFQIRYLMQLQQNNQNLKINLSKSEFDNIELDSGSNSIKNNPWFTNIIQDGFRFFEINNYDLGSISKVSTDSLVNKEFYKSYQHGHNENLVCVIGESAFNCKAWQNKSMSLEIAISTATILAEKISDEHEQKISLEITRNILDKFSNGMLNYKKELVHQFQLRSMDNILSQVIHKTINNYNKQYPDDQSPIDSSDFMTTLNKYPRLFEIDVLDQLKKEYVNNVKISAPFIKKLDRIQNIVNYFIIFESCLSSHKNIESNKGDLVKLSQSVILDKSLDHDDHISDTSSEDSDDSSDNETQPESLSLEEFFQITFGDEPISYDATNFVVDELTEEIFKVKVIPSLKDPTNGILRNIFPYIIDIINRTISLQRIQDCIRQISDSKELDDSSQTLKRLVDCKGRDYLVAFLDKVPKKALSKILLSLTRANIPIPLLFTNKNDFSQKGLRVLREIHSLILQENYHLLLSFNLTTSELSSPFSKMLYPIICKPREDGLSITSTGSIDISFHPASENYERKPIAIAEVYFEENPHQTFLSLINSFSQFAFYMFLHVNDQDFEGNSPSSELNQLLNTILAGSDNLFISKISVIYWSKSKKNNDPFSKRKKTLKKLLEPHFKSECIKIEQISNDFNQFTEKKKDDVIKKLSILESKIVHPSLFLKLLDGSTLNIWKSETEKSAFASKMKSIEFNGKSDIFRATHLEHEIEALNDKKSTTESQENSIFISEGEILNKIQQYRKEQVEINTKEPLSIFIDFAKLINENNIEKIRDFSCQIDDFFKKFLHELQNSKNDVERTEINRMIEENDISIHDFWLEFIILSELHNNPRKSVLEQLYNVNSKKLQEAFKTWILEGEPLQFLDGLSLRSLPTKFLSCVLGKLMTNVERRLIVISVIGLESSGKSTLLNYLFHCGFATSASRCTKGVYMSYRTANFEGNTIDLLILDSEGMASTTQKYITHRTNFDKKITLLALMCSQNIIINTKGLTSDIGDILEVSSWHLDALRHRQSKPRLHFVLRDMIGMIEAQEPAFKDIVDGLKKMFEQIPGCVDTLEDFMSVEQQDIHLLENAFSSYPDEFRSRTNSIGKTETINLPAEVFSTRISNLRQSLLKSALLRKNTSEQFTNVQGFIPYMKTVWGKINTYGSFLHFKNFKEIQEWRQMRVIVNTIKESELPEFITNSKDIINNCVKEIESDYSKWTQIEREFRSELDILNDNWTEKCLKYYSKFVQEQFDADIIEEGKRLIRNMITVERREQDAQWMSLVRKYKDDWLTQCAIKKAGKKIQGLNTTGFKKINEAECAKIFEDIWKEVEDDKKEFNRQMVYQSEKLKQHVQETFNNAVSEFSSTVRQDSKEKEKFKRVFWISIKKPSTLEENINIDVKQIQNIIEKTDFLSPFTQKTIKKKTAKEINDKFMQTIDGITSEIEFDIFEKYLRSQIYNTLSNNTIEWENQQKENLDNLKKNLSLLFKKTLANFSYESLSKEVLNYLSIAFKQQISEIEESVDQSLQNYLRESWTDAYTTTNHAYMQSFDVLNINEIREYLRDPIEYMNKIFNSSLSVYIKSLVNSKLCEIDNYYKNTIEGLTNAVSKLSSLFDPSKEYEQLQLSSLFNDLPVDFSKILKDVNNLLGSVTIKKPVDFCDLLHKSLKNIQNIWTDNEKSESKEKMFMYLEAKLVYWNKIGCSARCPLCSSKCELPDDGHTKHQVSKHLLSAFSGFRDVKTRFPTLIICTEDKSYNSKWGCDKDSIYLPLTEFLSKYHPSWLPFPRSEPSDEHIKKMRAIWWKLKDELCEEYSMIDNTDPLWKFKYGNLISE
ncbi:interferon-induced very large GTPase 1-like [Rhizophagus irregularis DAOM 181602=DAOM 197198]|nr:interferon-induced very large GTPase 1-like [Rhizophagus irregularis DAOM 181602=DAOM 197198]CAG8676061.1 531_t:CDS:10 [Rhizophagus irregularis]